MPARRRTGLWIAGVLGLAAVAGVAAVATLAPKSRRKAEVAAVALDDKSPLAALTGPLREGDGVALAVLFRRTALEPGVTSRALSEAEAVEWVKALDAARSGFARYGSYGRASAISVAARVLHRLGVEPAPAHWADTLAPAHDLLSAGLEDTDLDVRVTAMMELTNLWGWVPGRALLPPEEDVLADWKQGFASPVARRLGDREERARTVAVACLGTLPVDAAAAPAVAYLDDPRSDAVRNQVLVSFANRPSLLAEDTILKHLHDADPLIRETAQTVLQIRGLNAEQITLGGMIFDPKPEIRASVIPLLKERSDIDPEVWLLQLSHDAEDSVRIGALDALAARTSREARERLAVMAATDRSAVVRRAAVNSLPEVERTAALPPLPGSPSLRPKAN